MAHGETHAIAVEPTWDGGSAPYGIGSKKLGMWLFIAADTLTFSACLIAYSYVRLASPEWPRPFEWSSIVNAIVMTACLLSSSLTMVIAVAAAARGRPKEGGTVHPFYHPRRSRLYRAARPGVDRPDRPRARDPVFKPMGHPALRSHVLCPDRAPHDARDHWRDLSGDYCDRASGAESSLPEDVEVSGLYWHFVDLVWMFIFPMVYLLSNKM